MNGSSIPDVSDSEFFYHNICLWLHLSCPSSPRPSNDHVLPRKLFSFLTQLIELGRRKPRPVKVQTGQWVIGPGKPGCTHFLSSNSCGAALYFYNIYSTSPLKWLEWGPKEPGYLPRQDTWPGRVPFEWGWMWLSEDGREICLNHQLFILIYLIYPTNVE